MISQEFTNFEHVFGVVTVLKFLLFSLLEQVPHHNLAFVVRVHKIEYLLALVAADVLMNLVAMQVFAQFLQRYGVVRALIELQ